MSRPPPDVPSDLRDSLDPIVGAPARIVELPSGTTGPSYLVETASRRYVAKVFAPAFHALLGPAEQFELMRVLAEAGIAAKPIGFDRQARLLVTEFLEGTAPLRPESLRRPETIEKIVRCLRRLHTVNAKLPRFVPKAYAERYVSRAGGLESLSKQDRERYAELADLASALEGLEGAVCHNDLLAENLLANGDIKLVDFDYAVEAPPIVDLASLVVMNNLSGDEADAVLDAYFSGRAPLPAAEFARVQRLTRLISHFWALASGDVSAAIVARYRMADD